MISTILGSLEAIYNSAQHIAYDSEDFAQNCDATLQQITDLITSLLGKISDLEQRDEALKEEIKRDILSRVDAIAKRGLIRESIDALEAKRAALVDEQDKTAQEIGAVNCRVTKYTKRVADQTRVRKNGAIDLIPLGGQIYSVVDGIQSKEYVRVIPLASATMAAVSVLGQKKEKAARKLARKQREHGILSGFQGEIEESIMQVDQQLRAQSERRDQASKEIGEKDAQIKKNGEAIVAIIDLQYCLETACNRYRHIKRQVRRLRELNQKEIDQDELQQEITSVLQVINGLRDEFL